MIAINKELALERLAYNSWDIDEWELPHDQVTAGLQANAMDRKTIEDMEPIETEFLWKPFPKCKPKEDGEYLVTVISNSNICILEYKFVTTDKFECDSGTFSYYGWKVIAWKELPKPYERSNND